jgi:membrane protease YdiL (CAAX protease family)
MIDVATIATGILSLALLALASERARALAREWPLASALLVPALWLLRAAEARAFDPFAFSVVCALALSSVGALRSVEKGKATLTPVDAIVWLALFVPLDLRWSYSLWPGSPERTGGAYEFWAVAVAYLAALGWGGERALPSLGHRAPCPRDLGVGLVALVGFGAIAIPIGIATGFLYPPSLHRFEPGRAAREAAGIVLTVALPEEIFFRGVLDGGLRARIRSPALSLALSSFAFGLMHWPRRGHLPEQLTYAGLASLAGVFYGLAFRSGRGLPGAVLCHAAVDWIVAEFLRGSR